MGEIPITAPACARAASPESGTREDARAAGQRLATRAAGARGCRDPVVSPEASRASSAAAPGRARPPDGGPRAQPAELQDLEHVHHVQDVAHEQCDRRHEHGRPQVPLAPLRNGIERVASAPPARASPQDVEVDRRTALGEADVAEAVVQAPGVGSVRGRPYFRRLAITNDVSRIGTASTISGKISATVAAVFQGALDRDGGKDEAEKMRARVPRRCARGRSCGAGSRGMRRRRSPRARRPPAGPARGRVTANVAPAMALIPAASPSMPSSRLMTFIIRRSRSR